MSDPRTWTIRKRNKNRKPTGLRIKIGCVTFTPHGWDVWKTILLFNRGPVHDFAYETIWDLCRAGF